MFGLARVISPSFRESCQNHEGVKSRNEFIDEIARKLPSKQILIFQDVFLSADGETLIALKNNTFLSAAATRDTMLRLEQLQAISPETFENLVNHIQHGKALPDIDAICAETSGLGTTKDSPFFARTLRKNNIASFLIGMGSVLNLSGEPLRLPPRPRGRRLEFTPWEKVRNVVMSGVILQDGELRLVSPEKD